MSLELFVNLLTGALCLRDLQLNSHNMAETSNFSFTLRAFQTVFDFGLKRVGDGRPLPKLMLPVFEYFPFVLKQLL